MINKKRCLNKRYLGLQFYCIKCPIIKEGDNFAKIVVNSILKATFQNKDYKNVYNPGKRMGWETVAVNHYDLQNGDIIGITESAVARSTGLYKDNGEIIKPYKNKEVALKVSNEIKKILKEKTGADAKIFVYAGGTFKDSVSGILERDDSTTVVGHTDGEYLESTNKDLIARFMDLCIESDSKGTPLVLIKNYNKKL